MDKCETALKSVKTLPNLRLSPTLTPNYHLSMWYLTWDWCSHVSHHTIWRWGKVTEQSGKQLHTGWAWGTVGVQKFHQYLFWRNFMLLMDHQTVTSICGLHISIPLLTASRRQWWLSNWSGNQTDIRMLTASHVTQLRQAEISIFKNVMAAYVKRHTLPDPVLSQLMDVII